MSIYRPDRRRTPGVPALTTKGAAPRPPRELQLHRSFCRGVRGAASFDASVSLRRAWLVSVECTRRRGCVVSSRRVLHHWKEEGARRSTGDRWVGGSASSRGATSGIPSSTLGRVGEGGGNRKRRADGPALGVTRKPKAVAKDTWGEERRREALGGRRIPGKYEKDEVLLTVMSAVDTYEDAVGVPGECTCVYVVNAKERCAVGRAGKRGGDKNSRRG
jgi:hypothetical protein